MVESLTPQTVHETLESARPVAVLDVRPSLDYVEGHLLRSTWVPRPELERRLPALVPNRKTPVVLCDDSGGRTALDAAWIERLGYDDVSYLQDGVEAWERAGFDLIEAEGDVHATAFNYESKAFGEVIDAERDLPKITPEELAPRHDEVTTVDVRNPPEYEKWGTIPGSVNVEGVDVALYADELRDDDRPLVVHCAGRTRSIIGTATLRELGFSEVYELENGTMGWQLAGYDLADGPGAPSKTEVPDDRRDRLRESAEELLADSNGHFVTPAELDRLDGVVDERQSVYRFDVRTEAEYREGHLPGAEWVPGGQLIQTADRQIAVRDAEIVLISTSHVRSAITAYWLNRMGLPNVSVLRGGTTAWTEYGGRLETGRQETSVGTDHVDRLVYRLAPRDLPDLLKAGGATVANVGDLDTYEDGHVPCAAWIPRYDLEEALETGQIDAETIVLTCEDGTVSGFAAAQAIAELGEESVVVLEGGLSAWRAAGLPIEDDETRTLVDPRRAAPKPYAQSEAAMERYLEWEQGLVEDR